MSATQWDNTPVTECPNCHQRLSLRELIEDPQFVPRGMRFLDEDSRRNAYYFEHLQPGCGTTFAVPMMLFASQIAEPIPARDPADVDGCERHCFSIDDMADCAHECLYAPFRRYLIALKQTKPDLAG